jgi:hypothetical protein
VENFAKEYGVSFPVGWATIEQMMAYMGFTERPVVPQLILMDRNGNIHYETPRLGEPDSMKEEIISKRIEELIGMPDRAKAYGGSQLLSRTRALTQAGRSSGPAHW